MLALIEREKVERARKEELRLARLGLLEQEQMKLLEKESRMKEKERLNLENKMMEEKKSLELLVEKMLRKNYELQKAKQKVDV